MSYWKLGDIEYESPFPIVFTLSMNIIEINLSFLVFVNNIIFSLKIALMWFIIAVIISILFWFLDLFAIIKSIIFWLLSICEKIIFLISFIISSEFSINFVNSLIKLFISIPLHIMIIYYFNNIFYLIILMYVNKNYFEFKG